MVLRNGIKYPPNILYLVMHEHSHLIVLPNYSPKTDIKSSACLATQSWVAVHFPSQNRLRRGNSCPLCAMPTQIGISVDKSDESDVDGVQTKGACDSLDRCGFQRQPTVQESESNYSYPDLGISPRIFRRPYPPRSRDRSHTQQTQAWHEVTGTHHSHLKGSMYFAFASNAGAPLINN